MEKLSIENVKHHKTEKCFECGVVLTTENKSKWSSFALVNNESVVVDKCLWCSEILDRLRINSSRTERGLEFQKTKKEIENEMIKEGLTIKKLLIKELMAKSWTAAEIEVLLKS